jgi:hypothetical protein
MRSGRAIRPQDKHRDTPQKAHAKSCGFFAAQLKFQTGRVVNFLDL